MVGAELRRRCTLRPGGPIGNMVWRPLVPGPPGVRQGFRENYEAEIVAYELDKLLTLDMVPPTVERQIQGTKGSAQQWVEGVVDATDPTVPEGTDRIRWESDLLRMTMFDMLIGNGARVHQYAARWRLEPHSDQSFTCLRDRRCTGREADRGLPRALDED